MKNFSHKHKLRKLKSLTNLHEKCLLLCSCFDLSKIKIHQYSQALNYLSLETKEGCIKWETCQYASAKLQKISVYQGNGNMFAKMLDFRFFESLKMHSP